MADAVLYSFIDPGAPAVGLGSSIGTVAFYNLLVPCLVTGYGSGATAKPGQGWKLVHADLPTGFKLQSPDGVYYTFYLGSVPGVATVNQRGYRPSIQVYLSETLSDISAYPPNGQNVRSGDYSSGSTSTSRHWVCVSHYINANAKTWFLVARGSQVYIAVTLQEGIDSVNGEHANAGSASGSYGTELFFGNLVFKDQTIPKSGVQNHVVMGGFPYSETWDFSSETAYSYLGNYGRTRLRNPLDGVIENSGLPSFMAPANIYTNYQGYKQNIDLTPPDFTLERRPYYESGYVGYIPGLFIGAYYSFKRFAEIMRRLDRSVSYDSALVPLSFDSESIYILPTPYGSAFVNLSEKFWV